MNAEEQRVHDKAMDLVCSQGAEIERLRAVEAYAVACSDALLQCRAQFLMADDNPYRKTPWIVRVIDAALAKNPTPQPGSDAAAVTGNGDAKGFDSPAGPTQIDALTVSCSATPLTDAALVPDEGSIVEQLTACSRRLERLLNEVHALWPEIRQLQDGFMNGDPHFTAWDHSVRDRCAAMSFKLEFLPAPASVAARVGPRFLPKITGCRSCDRKEWMCDEFEDWFTAYYEGESAPKIDKSDLMEAFFIGNCAEPPEQYAPDNTAPEENKHD